MVGRRSARIIRARVRTRVGNRKYAIRTMNGVLSAVCEALRDTRPHLTLIDELEERVHSIIVPA